jgi:hypothetical protein
VKYIGLISSDARGKNGGNVASRNRFGTYLRKHVSPVQPRTPLQQSNRQTFGAISSQWRTLSAQEQQGWNTLATTVTFKNTLGAAYNPTGAQLFMLFSRNLTAGNGTPTYATAPTTLPTIPAVTSLTPTITVTSGAVSAISLAYAPEVPSTNWYFVYASKALGTGITFVSKSQFRFLTALTNSDSSPYAALTDYANVFGTPPITGKIFFKIRAVDLATGYYGPDILAQAAI